MFTYFYDVGQANVQRKRLSAYNYLRHLILPIRTIQTKLNNVHDTLTRNSCMHVVEMRLLCDCIIKK